MKKFGPCLLTTMFLFLGCNGSGDENIQKATAQMIYPEISLCDKGFVTGDTLVWQNFQLKNVGPPSVDMILYKVEVRGNTNCAFRVYREPMENEPGFQVLPEESTSNPMLNMLLPIGHSTIFRVEYTPSEEGLRPVKDSKATGEQYSDHATLVITANADVETHGARVETKVDIATGEVSEDETGVTRILIPLCGAAVLPAPDGGVPEECPRISGGAISTTLCKEPLPLETPGCK